jgi:hypothetical protein
MRRKISPQSAQRAQRKQQSRRGKDNAQAQRRPRFAEKPEHSQEWLCHDTGDYTEADERFAGHRKKDFTTESTESTEKKAGESGKSNLLRLRASRRVAM